MSWNRDADWDYIADGLERTADLLVGRWAQAEEVDVPNPEKPDVKVCVAIAMNTVFGDYGSGTKDVFEVFSTEVGIERETNAMYIVDWNDHTCESEQQAVDACRASAKRARQRGEGIETDRMIERMTIL